MRARHTATLLPDGRVLVAGGNADGSTGLAGAEVFDPSSPGWSTIASMAHAREGHTATLLPDERVLVAGGDADEVTGLDGVESLAPASPAGPWRREQAMRITRSNHVAVPLPDGRVLVAGGFTGIVQSATARAEIFDPSSRRWASTDRMSAARAQHAAASLLDGRVLVTGGLDGSMHPLVSAEIFDPSSEQWTPTASMRAARTMHTATPLPDGRVLVAGGVFTPFSGNDLGAFEEIFDPSTSTWTNVPPMSTQRYEDHSATRLSRTGASSPPGATAKPPPASGSSPSPARRSSTLPCFAGRRRAS